MGKLEQGGASFGSCVRARYEGRLTLDEFFRATESAIRSFSAAILRRWQAPSWVSADDMAQQFMVGCVWAFNHYDPERPDAKSIEQYVYYNGGDKAKKWLHKQRGAKLHGNADKNESRYEALFVDVARKRVGSEYEGDVEFISEALVVAPNQELALARREQWRRIIEDAPTPQIRWGILALVTAYGIELTRGDRKRRSATRYDLYQVRAARYLYDNLDVRLRLRLANERAALRIIGRTVEYLEELRAA